MAIRTLEELRREWEDTPEFHEKVHKQFVSEVNSHPELRRHRDWVEKNDWGYGERSFHWAWWLLAKQIPDESKFLEVGVHKGQSLSAFELCCFLQEKAVNVYGLSPLNGAGGYYKIKDYVPDVMTLFANFNGYRRPVLIRGMSTDRGAKQQAKDLGPYDVVYIDSDHGVPTSRNDMTFYPDLVNHGGYLVVDDSAKRFNMKKGMYKGWDGISRVVDKMLPPFTSNPDWQWIGNIVHLRIWRKIGA